MFAEYSDSDDDTKYEDGYIGAAERKKIKKKITKRTKANSVEDEEEPQDAEGDDLIAETPMDQPEGQEGNGDADSDELDYQVSIHASPYALFKKVIKFVPPEQHMASDVLSHFDYADIVAKETQRIERSDYLLINPGILDRADRIAESTINARKSVFKITKHVGHEIDFDAKIIYELHEVHDPNVMVHTKVNASEKM